MKQFRFDKDARVRYRIEAKDSAEARLFFADALNEIEAIHGIRIDIDNYTPDDCIERNDDDD